MKRMYAFLSALAVVLLLCFGLLALCLSGPDDSPAENRTLAERPAFTIRSWLQGDWQASFESWLSDHFPLRSELMELNVRLNGFYRYSPASSDTTLIVTGVDGHAEQGGMTLVDLTTPAPEPSSEGSSSSLLHATPSPSPEPTPEPEVYVAANTDLILVGDRAMEVPREDTAAIFQYAAAINKLQNALPGVRIFSLLTPNASAFYAPEDFRTGEHDQASMISSCYGQMNASVFSVDVFSALLSHTEENIFFRTDHHWTARGAYDAYSAFCEAAGFTPLSLSDCEYGSYEGFVGSMYNYMADLPQRSVLKDNPETVEYFIPPISVTTTVFSDARLQNGVEIPLIDTALGDEEPYRYLCFLQGDNPITIIDTDVEDGGTCLILKESYGNAFIPYLTAHYSRIIAVDPREFNVYGKPTLRLCSFTASMNVDDVIVLDYPGMLINSYYITRLERLAS